MSLEPIDKKVISNRFSSEAKVLKSIKDIIYQTTKVEVGAKLIPPNKLIVRVDNSSAASEISLVSDQLVTKINTYLESMNLPRIENLIIKQV